MDSFTLKVQKSKTALWFVTSPEIKGLLVAEHSRDEALNAVAKAIGEMEEALALLKDGYQGTI